MSELCGIEFQDLALRTTPYRNLPTVQEEVLARIGTRRVMLCICSAIACAAV